MGRLHAIILVKYFTQCLEWSKHIMNIRHSRASLQPQEKIESSVAILNSENLAGGVDFTGTIKFKKTTEGE